MNHLITQFLHYLDVERGFSPRTIKAYQHDLNKFAGFLESKKRMDIKKVSRENIRAFISELARNGYKRPNAEITRARKLSSIKSFFKYLVRYDILQANPAADIETPKLPQTEPSYLTQEEYQCLLSIIKPSAAPSYAVRDLAIVTLLLGTGVRLSELVGLTLNSVNLQPSQESIKVRGKGNKERIIPLNEEVVATLQAYLRVRPDVPVNNLFISRLGNGLSAGSVYHLIKHYLKEAGIKKDKLGVHSLRHTFGASLLNSGANLVVIQELLGHKKLETTRRYLHINNIDLRNAVEKLVLTTKQ